MAQLFTTTDLIASIKSRAMIPTSQSTYQAVDFLRFATEEIQVGLLPILLGIREEFYVTEYDQSVVKDQELYPIPERAIGRALRDLLFSSASPIGPRSDLQSLPRLEPDLLPLQRGSGRSSKDYMAFLRGDKVGLSPAPSVTRGTLRMMYHRRPSGLVEVAAASKIVSIDSATSVTVASVPSTIDASSVVDIVCATGGFRSKGDDLTLASVTAPTITFSSNLPSDLAVGDYISLSGSSPIPQIPLEMQPVLAQRVAVKCLEGLGDVNGVQVAQAKLNEMEKAALTLLTPRIRGEAKKIYAVNYYKNSYWG